MNQSTPSSVVSEPTPKVVRDLTALQNKARLGIHTWENAFAGDQPRALRTDLASNDQFSLEQIANEKVDECSLSLLPSLGSSPCAMRPFGCLRAGSDRPGYLVDLSQDTPDRAVVTRVYESNLDSGSLSWAKDHKLDKGSDIPEIQEAIDAQDANITLTRHHAVSLEGAATAERQLDALDRYMHTEFNCDIYPHRVGERNEVIATLRPQHIKAIVVPYYPLTDFDDEKGDWDQSLLDDTQQAYFAAQARLCGAIAGLQHIEAGRPLPVVMYHVAGAQQGELTLIGENKETFRNVALDALQALDEISDHHYQAPRDNLNNALKQFLCIDTYQNLTAQINRAQFSIGHVGWGGRA